MRAWQLQQAKARLSEVVNRALKEGPQGITVRGEPAVVVVSREEFDRLKKPRPSLVELLRSSPLRDLGRGPRREQTKTRDVSL